jgi:hypothetical protein
VRDALSKALDFVLLLAAGSAVALIIVCAAIGACVVAAVSWASVAIGRGQA